MTHVACRLTAKNRDPLRNPTLGSQVWAMFTFQCRCVCRRLSGVVQDYIHGEVLPRIGRVAVIALSICAFGSLCYFNYTDIGFANAIRLLYSQL